MSLQEKRARRKQLKEDFKVREHPAIKQQRQLAAITRASTPCKHTTGELNIHSKVAVGAIEATRKNGAQADTLSEPENTSLGHA